MPAPRQTGKQLKDVVGDELSTGATLNLPLPRWVSPAPPALWRLHPIFAKPGRGVWGHGQERPTTSSRTGPWPLLPASRGGVEVGTADGAAGRMGARAGLGRCTLGQRFPVEKFGSQQGREARARAPGSDLRATCCSPGTGLWQDNLAQASFWVQPSGSPKCLEDANELRGLKSKWYGALWLGIRISKHRNEPLA